MGHPEHTEHHLSPLSLSLQSYRPVSMETAPPLVTTDDEDSRASGNGCGSDGGSGFGSGSGDCTPRGPEVNRCLVDPFVPTTVGEFSVSCWVYSYFNPLPSVPQLLLAPSRFKRPPPNLLCPLLYLLCPLLFPRQRRSPPSLLSVQLPLPLTFPLQLSSSSPSSSPSQYYRVCYN